MKERPQPFTVSTYPSSAEYIALAERLAELYAASPIPKNEVVEQLVLYAGPTSLRRLLYLDRLYQAILDVPGAVMLFGVRWGRDLASFQTFGQLYEPMNYARRIIGFDTFSGFPAVSPKDGEDRAIRTGAYGVTQAYEEHLAAVLAAKRQLGTFAHMERVELHKGEAAEQLRAYLDAHPQTAVALAYFDLDLYEPTKACAQMLVPFLGRGAIVAFDEFIHPVHPGETVAAREVFGANARFRRIPHLGPGHSGYLVFDGEVSPRTTP